ncbi:hypothetical protein FOZ62_012960, partial [Perkinsus olseni]
QVQGWMGASPWGQLVDDEPNDSSTMDHPVNAATGPVSQAHFTEEVEEDFLFDDQEEEDSSQISSSPESSGSISASRTAFSKLRSLRMSTRRGDGQLLIADEADGVSMMRPPLRPGRSTGLRSTNTAQISVGDQLGAEVADAAGVPKDAMKKLSRVGQMFESFTGRDKEAVATGQEKYKRFEGEEDEESSSRTSLKSPDPLLLTHGLSVSLR